MTPTQPPVLESRGDEHVLRIERHLAHPPAKVWRAITEREQLSVWYPFPATDIDLRVGGRIRFAPMAGLTLDAEITELRPPQVFAFTVPRAGDVVPGGQERAQGIRIELSPDGPGCLLRFVQTFADRPAAASYAAGWQSCLDVLDAVAGGDPDAGAGGHPVSVPRYEDYVRLFGLDRGTASSTPAGWTVRFDRQLMMRPIEAVWAALCAAGEEGAPEEPVPGGRVPAGFVADGVTPGAVLAVEPGTALEYEAAAGEAAGRVRWELRPGPGGARIVLTQTGPAGTETAREHALAGWRAHLGALVRRQNAATG